MPKLITKISRWGLYALAFLLPLQTRYIFLQGELSSELHTGPWSYGDISLYGTDLLIILLVILQLINYWQQKKQNQNYSTTSLPKYLFWIFGLGLASLLSTAIAINPSLAWFALVKLIIGLSLFFLILTSKFNRLNFWFSFLAGASLQASVAIWQFFNQGNEANKWLGLASHTAKTLGTSVVEAENPITGLWERWLRAYGTLDHPNILGGLLAISLIIAIIIAINYYKQLKPYQSIILLISSTLLSAGLLVSFSRAAWLSLTIGLTILFVQKIKNWKIWLPYLTIILIVAGIFWSHYNYLMLSRLGDLHRVEVKSIVERLDYTAQAQYLAKKNWLTGVGIGNYGLAAKNLNNRQVSYWYQPVHNTWLLIFVETGIIGILSFMLLLAGLSFYIIQQPQTWSLPVLVSLLVILGLDHWWWSLHYGQLLLWLLLAMMIATGRKNPNHSLN